MKSSILKNHYLRNSSRLRLKKTLFININLNVNEKVLKKIMLSNNLKLFTVFKLNVDEEILQTFNAIVNFVFNKKDYAVAVCNCVKMKNVLQYKISNTQFKSNELMTIMTKFKRIHKGKNNEIVYLTH